MSPTQPNLSKIAHIDIAINLPDKEADIYAKQFETYLNEISPMPYELYDTFSDTIPYGYVGDDIPDEVLIARYLPAHIKAQLAEE